MSASTHFNRCVVEPADLPDGDAQPVLGHVVGLDHGHAPVQLGHDVALAWDEQEVHESVSQSSTRKAEKKGSIRQDVAVVQTTTNHR